jgi:hypothetical protein
MEAMRASVSDAIIRERLVIEDLDLASFTSVRKLAHRQASIRLDGLILNAGALLYPITRFFQ